MSEASNRPGLIASAAAHAGLLAIVLIGFAAAPRFDDATESVPVEMVDPSQLEQLTHGEKQATHAPPQPPQPPPDLHQSRDTPPPEPPMPPPPPPKPAPPPPKPAPPDPTPPRPEASEAPTPIPTPAKPKPVEPPTRPKETPREKPKPDELASLIAKEKTEDSQKPSSKPYDPKAIAKLLGQDKPAETPSPHVGQQGSPERHDARMSPSLAAQLDSWFKDAYMNCWSRPPGMPEGEPYIAEIKVEFGADGALEGNPVLVNPPSDPAWRAHAESAMRAVLKCNPMRVPAQFAPYFQQWREKTIHFDPRDEQG